MYLYSSKITFDDQQGENGPVWIGRPIKKKLAMNQDMPVQW